jgi:hypothetical protein
MYNETMFSTINMAHSNYIIKSAINKDKNKIFILYTYSDSGSMFWLGFYFNSYKMTEIKQVTPCSDTKLIDIIYFIYINNYIFSCKSNSGIALNKLTDDSTEYVNAEIAASALRNLENQDYKGRQLRINLQAIDKNKPLKPNEDLWKAKNDIIYVKNNQSGDENLINSLRGLTEEQKLLLLYSINVLSMKRGNDGNSDFDKLLKNQSDEVLDAIIDLQNSVIDEYKAKNNI